jgi:Carboxypeptidase regulatory-like domain/TonB-dependent Receptor Plug Domain
MQTLWPTRKALIPMATQSAFKRIAHLVPLCVCAALCLASVTLRGWGQVSTAGTMNGSVADLQGASVPQAEITVQSEATQLETHTTSNDSGAFVVPGLVAGAYDVTITKQGFETYKETNVLVSPAQVATVNVVLKVGEVTTTVGVQASAAQVQTSTPEISSQVSATQVATLPLNGRNYQSLSFLMPGVTNLSPDTALNQGGFLTNNTVSVNGMGAGGTMYYLDGIWNMNTGNMTQTTITPNPDTIEEVRVLQNNFGAEYSLNSTNVMLLETKSGTATFHGTAFEYLRNDALNARNYFATTVPPLKQNIFGYNLGGPFFIPGHYNKDRRKTFFFWSQQWANQHIGNIVRGADPTADRRNGTFTTPITDPETGQPFPQTSPGIYQIPASRINQDSLTLLNALAPLPNNSAGGFLNYLNATPTINTTRDDEAKGDQNLTSRLRLMGEYLDSRQTNNNATQTFISSPFSTTRQPITTANQLAQVRLTQILSSTMVNTTSLSMNNYVTNLGVAGLVDRSQVAGFSSQLPFAGTLSERLPQIGFSGGWPTLGVSYQLPIEHASDLEDTLSDDWSWERGNHFLQAGMQYVRGTKSQNDFAATAGEWMFSGQFTGDPIADYLIGKSASFTQTSDELRAHEHYPIVSPYVQDRWKISHRLTITAGVRYAFSPPPNFQAGLSNFVPSRFVPAAAPIVNPDGTITSTSNYNPLNGIVFNGVTPGIPRNYGNAHQNFWNPNVGFAYDVFGNGKASFRGGFGVTHSNFFTLACQWNCPNNYPLTVPITLITPNFPNPVGAAVAPTTVPGVTAQSMNLNEPQIKTFSLSFEQQFGGGWLLSIAGAGNVVTRLIAEPNINQPLPDGAYNFNPILNSGTVSDYWLGPYQGYGEVTYYSNTATGIWDGLEVNARHPVGHNVFFSGAYTWQKGLTPIRGTTVTFGGYTPQDSYHFRNDRGPTNATPSQILSFSAIWSTPWFSQEKGWRNLLLGNWQYSDVTSLQSGFPLDPGLSVATPGLATRPNRVGVTTIKGPKTVGQWFNTGAFATPAPGYFGNAATGSIVGPAAITFDMALYKDFKIGERQKFQFRSEFFNIFNHTNFSGVSLDYGAGNFGQVTSALDPRIIELVARYEF